MRKKWGSPDKSKVRSNENSYKIGQIKQKNGEIWGEVWIWENSQKLQKNCQIWWLGDQWDAGFDGGTWLCCEFLIQSESSFDHIENYNYDRSGSIPLVSCEISVSINT